MRNAFSKGVSYIATPNNSPINLCHAYSLVLFKKT